MSQRDPFFIPRADRRLGNRYELLECLGDGSYGWVWRAQRLDDNRIVAVKIPKERGARNEDLMEGSPLKGRAPHPNVIQIYWMDRVPPEREWYVIEMEYFPSVTLARLLDEGPQGFVASYDRVLAIYVQVLAGVQYLHSFGMCHGDIKPQNILVSGDTAKLTDFGSTALPEEMYVRTRENGGTILYSAPEVVGTSLLGRDFSGLASADIYSLGVLLYQLLTATLPHDTLSQVARHTPFPRPRELNTTVCPDLENFVLRCLQCNPADRWSSVSDMQSTFKQARLAQSQYRPLRAVLPRTERSDDWSARAVQLMEKGEYARAETVASTEFKGSQDPHAFLLMVSAAAQDGRFFDCLRELDSHPDLCTGDSPLGQELQRITLKCCLETRQIDRAGRLIDDLLEQGGQDPDLLFKKASVLGLQARYEEASTLLLSLNREYPRRPSVLRRLVLVFEQLRDTGKALAFLRAYLQEAPEDPWAQGKVQKYAALGLG